MQSMRSMAGVLVLLGLGYLISLNRREIKWRAVMSALAAQILVGALVIASPWGRDVLTQMAQSLNDVIGYGKAGTSFVFGGLASPRIKELLGKDSFIFAIQVLPMIVFFSSLISILYYLGVMRSLIKSLGFLLQKALAVSNIESFAAISAVIVGESKLAALMKPFIKQMSGPQLFSAMTSGMAAISTSVLAGYIGLGIKAEYVLAASVMSIPGGLLFGKLVCPDGATANSSVTDELNFDYQRASNMVEAASDGVVTGVRVATMVGATLIAFTGLAALADGLVGQFAGMLGYQGFTFQKLLGAIYAPVAFAVGVPWVEAKVAGVFLGQKMLMNEFVAYANLVPYLNPGKIGTNVATQLLSERTLAILSVGLCGFANFSSIGIVTSTFSLMNVERRSEIASYGFRAMLSATLSNLMSAAIMGMFFIHS